MQKSGATCVRLVAPFLGFLTLFSSTVRGQFTSGRWLNPPIETVFASSVPLPSSIVAGITYTQPSYSPWHMSFRASGEASVLLYPGAGAVQVLVPWPGGGSSFVIRSENPGRVIVQGSSSITGEIVDYSLAIPFFGALVDGHVPELAQDWESGLSLSSGQSGSQANSAVIQIATIGEFHIQHAIGVNISMGPEFGTNNPPGYARCSIVGGWDAYFIPEVSLPPATTPPPIIPVGNGDSTCPEFDTRNGVVYIFIHGWNSRSDASWIQNAALGITQNQLNATSSFFDWAELANTGQSFNPFTRETQAAKALNNARIAGGQLADRILKAMDGGNCQIDLSKIVIVAHSYGGEVANIAAAELNALGKGKIGQLILIDMPQQVGGGDFFGAAVDALIKDFHPENFGFVSNLILDESLTGTGFGLALDGANVANIRLNEVYFLSGGLTAHERAALYIASLLNTQPNSLLLRRDLPAGDYDETSSGNIEPLLFSEIQRAEGMLSPQPESIFGTDSARQGVEVQEDGVTTLTEPAFIVRQSVIPTNADFIRFSYAASQNGDGDTLSLQFNDQLLFFAPHSHRLSNGFLDSGLIGIRHLAGTNGTLSFVLNSSGETNAQFVLRDLHFYTVLPLLKISRGTNDIVLSWSAATPGFAVQSSTNLNAGVGWMAITNSVLATNAEYIAAMDNDGLQRFFRLARP